MTLVSKFGAALLAITLTAGLAQAQTPKQIQALIAQGQASQALADLQPILQNHPQSGVAWYLTAEADDALGNESAAQTALNNAEQYAPGLPFARPDAVAALQAHLANPSSPAPYRHHGFSPVFWIIGGLAILFILLRMGTRRRSYGYRDGYAAGFPPGAPQNPYPPYGPAGYGPGGYAQGGGLGSSLLGGLAAGAGFAAGERIIDDVMGGNRDSGFIQNDSFDNNIIPDRDDGLNGNPGWDAGDPNNNGGDVDSSNW